MRKIPEWDHRFLNLCLLIGSWSNDPDLNSAACIVNRDNKIIAIGHSESFYNGSGDLITVEAEEVVLFLSKDSIEGFKVYTTSPPSIRSTIKLLQMGIREIVTIYPNENYLLSNEDLYLTMLGMLREAGVKYTEYNL